MTLRQLRNLLDTLPTPGHCKLVVHNCGTGLDYLVEMVQVAPIASCEFGKHNMQFKTSKDLCVVYRTKETKGEED